ncbi:MAG: prephenate dehydrogenase/arogenate dehydrogenase family protein [Nitrososphaera sp.]
MAIIGAAGKMGSWFSSYFVQRGLEVLAYDINDKELRMTSGNIKVLNNISACVREADLVLVCVPVQKTPHTIKECTKSMKDGAIIGEISSVKKKTIAALKKTPSSLQPLCIHPMFGPGASKTGVVRMLLIPVRDEKKEMETAKGIFENAKVMLMADAKQHDKAIGIVLGLTYFANIVFAKLMISSDNISMLKQVSGTTFALQSLIAESILTEESELVVALIGENVYAKRYIQQFIKDAAELAKLASAKDRTDLKTELNSVKLNIQKSQDLSQSYHRMYEILSNAK